MKRLFIILLALISVSVVLADKSQRTIKQEQQRTNKEIKETAKKISSNKKKTKKQLNLLDQLSTKITQNTDELNHLKASIDSINVSMYKLNDSINLLEGKLTKLRENYKNSLRSIRATRHSTSNLAFIFSSKSFADAYRRIRYLRQFNSWQNGKTQELRNTINAINEAKASLVELHKSKTETLKLTEATQQKLQQNQAQQTQVVAELQKERSQLDAYMKEKQKEAQQLDAQLEQLIKKQQELERKRRAEAEKKRKEQERKKKEQERALAEKRKKEAAEKKQDKTQPAPKPKTPVEDIANDKDTDKTIIDVESEAQRILSDNFEGNKGKLPYPVSGKCRIVGKFGRHKHPDLPYVETNNNGIDIELISSNVAKAVFEGKVSAIFQQPGFNSIVMIRHGSYITVYANLSTLNVKPGDEVKINQTLGEVYSDPDDDNRRILHFEVRKETQKLNPQHWIK